MFYFGLYSRAEDEARSKQHANVANQAQATPPLTNIHKSSERFQNFTGHAYATLHASLRLLLLNCGQSQLGSAAGAVPLTFFGLKWWQICPGLCAIGVAIVDKYLRLSLP